MSDDYGADLGYDAPPVPQATDATSMPDLVGLEQKYNLPSGLLSSAMKRESNGDPNAVSPAGAQGLFQFMPRTAKQYGIDPLDPNQAADGAARMYADLSKKYNGDVPSMLAAYNWGQGNVDRQGLGSAPKETRDYINHIMGDMNAQKTEMRLGPMELASDTYIEAIPQTEDYSDALGYGAPKSTSTPQAEDYGADLGYGKQANTLSGDIDKDIGNRWAEVQRGINSGELTPLQSGLHGTAQLVGMGSDVAGNLIKRIPGYEAVKNAASSGAQWVADKIDNPTTEGVATGTADAASEWVKSHPNTARAAGDVAGILGGVYAGAPLAESAGKALANMGEASGVSTNAALAGIPKMLPESAPAISASDIRNVASQSYKSAEAQGGVLSPQVTNSFIDKAQEVLPQTDAGKIVLGETPTTKLVDNLEGLRGKPLTLAEAQEIDSALGDKMSGEVDPKTGKLNADGNKLLQIQQNLRDAIESAGEGDVSGGKSGFDSWNQGRQLWSASLRMNDIQRILDRASMMDNPVTGIKTGFRTLASNPARLRGFTPQEASLIKRAAKTGIVTDALRWGGSRLISSMTGMAAGAAGSGGIGALAGSALGYGAGMPLRAAANALQRGRGNAVLKSIVNRPAIQAAFKPAEMSAPSGPSEFSILGNKQLPAPPKQLALPAPEKPWVASPREPFGKMSDEDYARTLDPQSALGLTAADTQPYAARNDPRAPTSSKELAQQQALRASQTQWDEEQSRLASLGHSYKEIVNKLGERPGSFKLGGAVKKFAKGGLVNTNPTDAQKAAGNYKKHHIRLHGMEIAIENPKGSIRSGKDKTGKEWRIEMPAHYGYFKGTTGKDGDAVDVYIGDKPHVGRVYVVNQVHDHNGQFDEHKAMMGFSNKTEALDHYKKAFSDGKGSMRIGSVKAMSVQELKDWLKRGDLKKKAA